MQTWVEKGHMGVTWPNIGILGPPNIARTVVVRNFKFGTETKGGKLERKKMQNWVKRGHVTQFWNFGTPVISRERLKLEASNLARRRTATSSNEKNAELGQKVSCGGHVTQFWNFGNPLISREQLKLETSSLARRRTAESFNGKMQNWIKRGHVGVTSPNSGILGPP